MNNVVTSHFYSRTSFGDLTISIMSVWLFLNVPVSLHINLNVLALCLSYSLRYNNDI